MQLSLTFLDLVLRYESDVQPGEAAGSMNAMYFHAVNDALIQPSVGMPQTDE